MDWNKIKLEYISENTSYRKLAEKYKLPFGTLREVAKREKWTEIKAQIQHKSNTKIIEIESNKQAERMKRLLTVSDKLLEVVEDAVNKLQSGELLLDKSTLKSLSGTIKDIKDIQNIKSELDTREQEARIAKYERDSESGAVDDVRLEDIL